MIRLTKQMKKDIRKIKEQDLIVCQECGKGDIEEKIWVDTNSYVSIDGEAYYKYGRDRDDNHYWCNKCNDMCHPLHITEYEKEKKWKDIVKIVLIAIKQTYMIMDMDYIVIKYVH